jgi:hypothetical protein
MLSTPSASGKGRCCLGAASPPANLARKIATPPRLASTRITHSCNSTSRPTAARRAGGEEVPEAVPELFGTPADKRHAGLVDQGRRLEGLAESLVGLPPRRHLPEFVVDEREQLGCGLGVAGLGRGEDLGDVRHGRLVYPPGTGRANAAPVRSQGMRPDPTCFGPKRRRNFLRVRRK